MGEPKKWYISAKWSLSLLFGVWLDLLGDSFGLCIGPCEIWVWRD